MKRMLCRNKVRDFDVWEPIFTANLPAAAEAGLTLENLWRNTEDPNEVFFVLKVENQESAQAFTSDPSSAETGRRSGVLEGDCWFVE